MPVNTFQLLLEIGMTTFGATMAMQFAAGQNGFVRALAAGAGSYVADMLAMSLFLQEKIGTLKSYSGPEHTQGFPMLTVLAVILNEQLNLTSDTIAIFLAQLLYALSIKKGEHRFIYTLYPKDTK